MSTAAIDADPTPADIETPAIKRARAILAKNRALTSQESQAAHDDMWRAAEAGERLTVGVLRAIYGEIDRKSSEAAMAQIAKRTAEGLERLARHAREKPQRWRQLPPIERAALIVADEVGPTGQLGRAFLRFAQLSQQDERTAAWTVPETFEPSAW